VCKLLGVISRVLMALIFFVSVLFIINNIYNTPNGYSFISRFIRCQRHTRNFCAYQYTCSAHCRIYSNYWLQNQNYCLCSFSLFICMGNNLLYERFGRATAIINVTSISCNLWRSSALSVKPRNWLQY